MIKDFQTEIKVLLIVVAIAIVIVVGGVLLLKTIVPVPSPTSVAQQTPPPALRPQSEVFDTSTWQTYRNEEFGFEVEYPNNFIQWEESPSKTLPRTISFHRKVINGFEGEGLYITVSDRREYKQYYQGNDPVKTLDDYAAELTQAHRNSVFDEKDKKVAVNETSIGKKGALEITYGDGKTLIPIATEPDIYVGPIQYIVLINGKFYTIEYHTDDDGLITLFDQILSTFRFTPTP